MKQWINVTLDNKFNDIPGNSVGIKVWAYDNIDAMVTARNIIDNRFWDVANAGPTTGANK